MKTITFISMFFLLSAKGFVRSMGPRIPLSTLTPRIHSQTSNKNDAKLPAQSSRKSAAKVVTDVDDTVKSSGGVKLLGIPLGGIDTRFKRGIFYPGAFQFAFELSMKSVKGIPENVAVLTARAREFKFALALKPTDKLCSAYRAIGERNGYGNWGIGDVYYGSVVEWIFQNRKGLRKFENFNIMLQNDISSNRHCEYILIGDTGEKDEEAGDRIAQQYGRSRLQAIFLHAVSDNKDNNDGRDLIIPKDRVANGVPIFYFRTYVGAALKAYKSNLISSAGLNRVIDAARSDLDKIPKASEGFKRSLESDIADARGRRRKSAPLAFFSAPRTTATVTANILTSRRGPVSTGTIQRGD